MVSPPKKPLATYRLQVNHEFRLADAKALVNYLARLGITHLYLSPILRARTGSNHGYDVVDPHVINPELGDETGLRSLVADLRKFGLGLILDIVPNHMATSFENPYWRDVLTYGPASPFAGWFDIDWRLPDPNLWGRVLVPVLGARSVRVLQQDQIRLAWSDGRFLVHYFDQVFPVDPATVPSICASGLPRLRELLGGNAPLLGKITAILARLEALPRLPTRRRRRARIDRNATEDLLAQFAQQIVQSPRTQEWAEETAAQFTRGEEGRRRLKQLLDHQPYRLTYWRQAARKLNYRRFFDINDLISIRQEDPQVFGQTHATIFRWIEEGLIDGLRIDHIDGLRTPPGYLHRLDSAIAERTGRGADFPIFVEKILAPSETVPADWPVWGTTGYEFIYQVEGELISWPGFSAIVQEYRQMLRRPVRFEQVTAWGKRRVLRQDLSAPVRRLAQLLHRFAHPATPTFRDLFNATIEVMVALPVYRTYLDTAHGTFSEADSLRLREALEIARRSHRTSPEAVEILRSILLPDPASASESGALHGRSHFVERFQQLSGPAAAKGIEDTAFYSYVPLASLNEVGSDPRTPAENATPGLHRANQERAAMWPASMLAVTTHDTKRTADVRARLDVLSEMPRLWWRLVRNWRRMNRPLRSEVRGRLTPGAATEYLFYQTVAGIWPAPDPNHPDQLPGKQELDFLSQRLADYMLKAIREAKTWTSWTQSDSPYEDAVLAFVRQALSPISGRDPEFLSSMQGFVSRIARPGFWNSLSRTVLQFTSPGTPDIFQGDELWNFALVDPDNRRPVDFSQRQQMLDDVILAWENKIQPRPEILRKWLDSAEDGRIKLHLIHRLLRARQEHPELFGSGSYDPLEVTGPLAPHLFGFVRTAGEATAVVLVSRLTTTLAPSPACPPVGLAVWPEENCVRLPGGRKGHSWCCLLSGKTLPSLPGDSPETVPVHQLLAHLPVALLVRQP